MIGKLLNQGRKPKDDKPDVKIHGLVTEPLTLEGVRARMEWLDENQGDVVYLFFEDREPVPATVLGRVSNGIRVGYDEVDPERDPVRVSAEVNVLSHQMDRVYIPIDKMDIPPDDTRWVPDDPQPDDNFYKRMATPSSSNFSKPVAYEGPEAVDDAGELIEDNVHYDTLAGYSKRVDPLKVQKSDKPLTHDVGGEPASEVVMSSAHLDRDDYVDAQVSKSAATKGLQGAIGNRSWVDEHALQAARELGKANQPSSTIQATEQRQEAVTATIRALFSARRAATRNYEMRVELEERVAVLNTEAADMVQLEENTYSALESLCPGQDITDLLDSWEDTKECA